MKQKSIVGDLINFRGLVYSPTNEDGVIFLFGKVVEDLNMYIEEIKPGFPDCMGRRFTGKGWERVAIEFEFRSSNFELHDHDPNGCDMIVCWEHNWPTCPLEVIELREVIKSLPNKPIQHPETETAKGTVKVEDHLRSFPQQVGSLFLALDTRVKEMSEEIWHKVREIPGVTYYSPERVFIYLEFQQRGLRLTVFTRGESIRGVKSFDYKRGGSKWGRIVLRNQAELDRALPILRRSHELIKLALKDNEPTGWYAELEQDSEEEEEKDTSQ